MLISKGRIGIVKKYLNKMKIVEHCDSIIYEVPMFTVDILEDVATYDINLHFLYTYIIMYILFAGSNSDVSLSKFP